MMVFNKHQTIINLTFVAEEKCSTHTTAEKVRINFINFA